MNILWIGSLYWLKPDGRYVFNPKEASSVSASAFSQAIIEGLEQRGNRVTILGTLNWGESKKMAWSHNNESKNVFLRGTPHKYINIWYKSIILKKEIKKNKSVTDDVDVVLVYGTYLPYVNCACEIKRLNPKIKIVLICPDLSEFMDPALKRKPIKRFFKSFLVRSLRKKYYHFDGFITFSPKMIERLNPTAKNITVEGVYNDANIIIDDNIKKTNCVLYAGTLSSNFGIQNLIDAFELLKNDDISLHIYGSGELESFIKQKASELDNVFFGGLINRSDLFVKYREACLLINVRNPLDDYTKYSFPSKTFEYLASGTPFMTTKLEGVPVEYNDYLLLLDDNSPQTIASGIRNYLKMTQEERNQIGSKGRAFVISKKNKVVQSEKIETFLKTIIEN